MPIAALHIRVLAHEALGSFIASIGVTRTSKPKSASILPGRPMTLLRAIVRSRLPARFAPSAVCRGTDRRALSNERYTKNGAIAAASGDRDTAIPPKLHAFMAERARARATSVVEGASHVVMISHSEAVAKVIEDAATAR